MAVISNGCYFGDVGLFFDIKRTATAQCATLSNLFSIDQQSLFKLLDDFEEERSYMINVATSRLKRINEFNAMEQASGPEMTYVDEEDKKTELLGIAHMLGKYQDSLGNGADMPPVVIKKKRSTANAPVADRNDRNRRSSTMGGPTGGRKMSNMASPTRHNGGRVSPRTTRTSSLEWDNGNKTSSQNGQKSDGGLFAAQEEVKMSSRYGSQEFDGTPRDSPRLHSSRAHSPSHAKSPSSSRQHEDVIQATHRRRESLRGALDTAGAGSKPPGAKVVPESPGQKTRALRIIQEARGELRRQSDGQHSFS